MTDKMREEFEKWASGKELILRKSTSGKQFYYLFEDTDYAWQAWQAARTVPDAEALTDIIAAGLRGTYHCTRVWSAWGIGTMSEDDFSSVEESDTPAEIAESIISMLSAAPEGKK